jgi:hypothetical protein
MLSTPLSYTPRRGELDQAVSDRDDVVTLGAAADAFSTLV